MSIQAQLADGRVLEFPDGTDPSVIQSTVKKVLGVAEAAAPAPTPAASAPAPTASSILGGTPIDPQRDDFSSIFRKEKAGFFPGEEVAKGVKAGFEGLKAMPSAFKLSAGSETLVDAQNTLNLLNKIDAGQIGSVRELRQQPGFNSSVGMYYPSSPEVRNRIRADVTASLLKNKEFVKTALSAVQQYQTEAQKYRGRTEDLTDVRSITDFGNWLSKSMGEGAVQLAPLMAAAYITKSPGVLALGTGMELAGGIQNRVQFLGEEIKNLPEDQKLARVSQYLTDTNDTTVAAAILAGSLDAVLGPAARAAKVTAKNFAEFATRKGAAKAAAKELPRDVAGEFATGAAQEAVNVGAETRLGELKDPFTLQTAKRIVNAAAKEAAGAPVGTAVNVARAAAFTPPLQGAEPPPAAPVEPTMGQAPAPATAPAAAPVEPTMGQAPAAAPAVEPLPPGVEPTGTPVEPLGPGTSAGPTLQEQEDQLFEREKEALIASGAPEDSAIRIATRRVQEARKRRITDLIAKPSQDEIENRAKELIDGGMDPARAIDEAATQITAEREADALAASELEGVGTTEPYVPPTAREGVEVAGQPAGGTPAGGVGVAEPNAVVPAGQALAADVGREGVQPTAVEPTLTEETNGPEAPETQQAEAQGQEAPAAAGAPAGVEQVAPGKKRGRPAVLTPEEKAAKGQERKVQRAVSMKADRAVTRLVKKLDELAAPLDEGEFTSDQAFQDAVDEQVAQRRDAIKELLTLQGDPSLRGTKTGQRVKEALGHPSISAQERASVQTGIDAQKKALEAAASVSRSTTGAPADARFNKFTNGAQALSHIIKTGNAFQKAMGKRLRSFVGGVKFVVVEAGQPAPAQLQNKRNAKAWDRARALYIENGITGEKVVYVRGESFGGDQGINNVTVLHELLHAATNRKVTLALDAIARGVSLNDPLVRSAKALLRTMESAGSTYNEMARAGTLPPEVVYIAADRGGEALTDAREFIAYGMSDENFQQFLMKARGYEEDTSFFNRFVRGIRSLFGMGEDTTNALSDLILVTDTILSSRAPKVGVFKGSVSASVIPENEDEFGNPIRTEKELKEDSTKAAFATETSRAFEAAQRTDRVLPMLRRLVARGWMGMSENAVKALVAQPTFTFLADWSGIQSLKDAEKNVQMLNGMAASLLTGAHKVISPVEKALNPLLFAGRKAKLRKDLEDLVYQSTIARYDPSDPNKKESDSRLDAMYQQIGPEGRKLYKMVRDYYSNLIDLYSDLLDQQIENLRGVSPEVKNNLMLTLRRTFEAEARIKPYFPLVRHGDYWARIEVDKAPVFLMFESAADREAAMREFAKERETSYDELRDSRKITFGEGQRKLRFSTQGQSAMLTQIFDALDKENFDDAEAKESLKDSIYQIYLATMPEQSFRNQFLRRKDRIGFSTDLIRNMATSASKMSIQLARLKYAPILRNNIDAAADVAEDRDNLRPFVEEARKRVETVLKGPTDSAFDAIAGAANKVSYFMYLSASASALIQPASIYITALPVLGANHGSMTKAAKELAKAVGDIRNYGVTTTDADGTVSLAAPSLSNSTRLNPDERRAIKAMEERGISRNTYANLIWARQGVATDYASTTLGKVGKLGKEAGNLAVGALMHNVERLTREATFLAAYRLGRARFLKEGLAPEEAHLAAIDQAASDVNESLADYDISNRPRWMQQGLGRIIGQFKMFPIHTMLLLGTNFVKMLPLLNKEGKAAAMKKFLGIFTTSASLAGLSGIPLFGTIAAAIAWMVGKAAGEDEDEGKKELRETDPVTWFRTVFLPDHFGEKKIGNTPLSEIIDTGPLNALTGAAIAERIGLGDLLGRDTKETRTAREGLILFALDHMGPLPSTALSFADAYDAVSVGDYQKAVEKITPAILRNPIVANRLKEEGIKDAKGQVVIPAEEFTAWKLFMQRIGFRPAEVARMAETSFRLTSAEQRILGERQKVLDRIKVQARKESEEGDVAMERVIEEEVSAFNNKHPGFGIDADDIYRALLADAEKRGSSRYGVTVTEKNAAMTEAPLNEIERRIEREKKGGK